MAIAPTVQRGADYGRDCSSSLGIGSLWFFLANQRARARLRGRGFIPLQAMFQRPIFRHASAGLEFQQCAILRTCQLSEVRMNAKDLSAARLSGYGALPIAEFFLALSSTMF